MATDIGIVGFGSIARKHLGILLDINPGLIISVCTSQNIDEQFINQNVRFYNRMEDFLRSSPKFILLAKPSSERLEYLNFLTDVELRVLFEKPIAAQLSDAKNIKILCSKFRFPSGCLQPSFLSRFRKSSRTSNFGESGESIERASSGRTRPSSMAKWQKNRDYRLWFKESWGRRAPRVKP